MVFLLRCCFLWETCRLVYELSNERTVVLNKQFNTHTEGHITGTDLTNFGATVVSLVQMFHGFKKTHYKALRQRLHLMQFFCFSKSPMLGHSGLQQW
jgi:hypothetical protein